MTLAAKLLPRLNEWRPADTGRSLFTYIDSESGNSVALNIDKADTFSCLFWDISAQFGAGREPLSAADLRACADRVARSVTGLMEPLRVIEVDVTRGEALLRSESPTVRNEQRMHYELLLSASRRVDLRRFQAATDPTSKRTQVAFVLSHEVVGKMVDDVAAVLS